MARGFVVEIGGPGGRAVLSTVAATREQAVRQLKEQARALCGELALWATRADATTGALPEWLSVNETPGGPAPRGSAGGLPRYHPKEDAPPCPKKDGAESRNPDGRSNS